LGTFDMSFFLTFLSIRWSRDSSTSTR
jgi:hypothetical protein